MAKRTKTAKTKTTPKAAPKAAVKAAPKASAPARDPKAHVLASSRLVSKIQHADHTTDELRMMWADLQTAVRATDTNPISLEATDDALRASVIAHVRALRALVAPKASTAKAFSRGAAAPIAPAVKALVEKARTTTPVEHRDTRVSKDAALLAQVLTNNARVEAAMRQAGVTVPTVGKASAVSAEQLVTINGALITGTLGGKKPRADAGAIEQAAAAYRAKHSSARINQTVLQAVAKQYRVVPADVLAAVNPVAKAPAHSHKAVIDKVLAQQKAAAPAGAVVCSKCGRDNKRPASPDCRVAAACAKRAQAVR